MTEAGHTNSLATFNYLSPTLRIAIVPRHKHVIKYVLNYSNDEIKNNFHVITNAQDLKHLNIPI